MSKSSLQQKRIIAIDPTTRGFGYVVLEGPATLIDWGVKEIRTNKKVRCLKLITRLIDQYLPDVIVVENVSGKGSRRCPRVRELLDEILNLASEQKISMRAFSRDQIREVFSPSGAHTKHQIAKEIVRRLPELEPRLPPFRKPWMSEDSRMSIFDAMSLAMTFYGYS